MTHRVASLGMYDSPGLRAANDALWTAIAQHLRSGGIDRVPEYLDRSRPLDDIWSDPDLLLAQTCGYPLVTRFQDRLRYVATPRYRAPGCAATAHRSRIIVRTVDGGERLLDYRGRTAAVNDLTSNTGMNLFRAAIGPLAIDGAFFGAVIETGSHAASARHVADGEADIASIDAVTFAHLAREEPGLTHRLRTLGWTAATPGLPFVTSVRSSDELVRQLREAIAAAIKDQPAAADAPLLDGVEEIGIGQYETVLRLERQSIDRGYPRLD